MHEVVKKELMSRTRDGCRDCRLATCRNRSGTIYVLLCSQEVCKDANVRSGRRPSGTTESFVWEELAGLANCRLSGEETAFAG